MPLTASRPSPRTRRRGTILDLTTGVATTLVALASIAVGSAALFVRPLRDAGIEPASLAFFRYAITAIVFAPALNLTSEKRRATVWGLVGGAAVALGWIAYADALGVGDLATTGVAYMTYPIFSLVACRLVFGKHPGLRSTVGGLLVLLAAAVALGPTALLDVSPMLFVAPATFGFSIAVLTERLGVLSPSERLAAVATGATLTLTPVMLSLSVDEIVPTSTESWTLLLGIALGCGLVPMWIYGAAAPRIGPGRTAVAGATELPTMFIIGSLIFDEAIEPQYLVAAAIIIGSVALTPSAATQRRPGSDRPQTL